MKCEAPTSTQRACSKELLSLYSGQVDGKFVRLMKEFGDGWEEYFGHILMDPDKCEVRLVQADDTVKRFSFGSVSDHHVVVEPIQHYVTRKIKEIEATPK